MYCFIKLLTAWSRKDYQYFIKTLLSVYGVSFFLCDLPTLTIAFVYTNITAVGNSPCHSLQWCHNEGDSNHQPHDCLLNRLFKARIKENIKTPCHWPLWEKSTGERWIPPTRASNGENVSIWWCHHVVMAACDKNPQDNTDTPQSKHLFFCFLPENVQCVYYMQLCHYKPMRHKGYIIHVSCGIQSIISLSVIPGWQTRVIQGQHYI